MTATTTERPRLIRGIAWGIVFQTIGTAILFAVLAAAVAVFG